MLIKYDSANYNCKKMIKCDRAIHVFIGLTIFGTLGGMIPQKL